MLTVTIAVPPEGDAEEAAHSRLLHEAHLQRLHLARPLDPTITLIRHGIHDLAHVMDLPTENCTFYKVECETEPCPPT
ncbi:hypothetical protein ACWDHW_08235 [Streptomyces melanosporofaciens]